MLLLLLVLLLLVLLLLLLLLLLLQMALARAASDGKLYSRPIVVLADKDRDEMEEEVCCAGLCRQ
jgi:hypothetical protein